MLARSATAPALNLDQREAASALNLNRTQVAPAYNMDRPQASRASELASGPSQTGSASYYHPSLNGLMTANGETFDDSRLTAAHRTLRFGTRVRVTNLSNSKSVVVKINDRGPFVAGRIIDLSRRAANALGFVQKGVTRVRVQPLSS
jgi:peptidoglycan lytic transglycosylase